MKKLLALAALLVTSTIIRAQLGPAGGATNLFEGETFAGPDALGRKEKVKPLPANTRQVKVEITIFDPAFNKMPVTGFEEGVWVTFLNDADEPLSNSGKPVKGPLQGFGLGVNTKTVKPKVITKTATVPPGATKIKLIDLQWASGMLTTGSKPTYTIDKIVVTPL